MFREPTASATTEIVVRNSRFVATAAPVGSLPDAEAEILRVRTDHPDASHVVYAFLIGDEKTEQAGLSDAGEPKGTAGRPVMEILRGSGVRDVILTVVRYFGGTKLGTGGLVHAYGDAARSVLDALPTRERVERVRCEVVVAYDLIERIRQFVAAADGVVIHEEFAERVTVRFEVPASARAELATRVQDLSRGSVDLHVVD
jgi:uncharacterized YigZ family protein